MAIMALGIFGIGDPLPRGSMIWLVASGIPKALRVQGLGVRGSGFRV